MAKEFFLEQDHYLTLPQGDAAAALRGCSYVVPGLFQYAQLVYKFMTQVRAKFAYDLPISNIYGSPNVKWNGGRLMMNVPPHQLADIEKELQEAFAHGVQPLLTFTNVRITQADLQDHICNAILDLLQRRGGAVLVASEILQHHIRENYPDVQIHASVVLTARESERTKAFYQSFAQRYDRFVVHPDDLFRSDLMEKIAYENAEIMINERCLPWCRQRYAHYESISREQMAYAGGCWLNEKFLDNCPFIPESKQRVCRFRNLSLTIGEVQTLVDAGIKYVKLQGRTDSPELMFFDLHRYMLEPQVAFPHMYCIFQPQIEEYFTDRCGKN